MARLAALLILFAVASCGDRDIILPGEREEIRPASASSAEGTPPPVALPAVSRNAEWTHLNGGRDHLAPNAALGTAPTLAWSVSIGEGNARRQRISAAPVVAGGRIFTLDASATVTAVSTSGEVLWSRSLAPEAEGEGEGFGGGLAADDGALLVTTGFAEVIRLDPATGDVLWRRALDGVVRAAPTLGGETVMVAARGDLAYGLNLADGEISWRIEGQGQGPGLFGGASPAVRGPLAVFPFVTGEVRGVLVRNGLTVWSASVTGGRRANVRSVITDISGDPVIDFDIVYVANQAGRLVALDRRSGERLWTQQDGSYGPALPVGDSVFLVTDMAEVVRIDAFTGEVLWRATMPEWVDPTRRRTAVPHYGPLLAAGRLVVASGDGLLRSFDPRTGNALGDVALPGGAAAQPAIANSTIYVVTGDGRLSALR